MCLFKTRRCLIGGCCSRPHSVQLPSTSFFCHEFPRLDTCVHHDENNTVMINYFSLKVVLLASGYLIFLVLRVVTLQLNRQKNHQGALVQTSARSPTIKPLLRYRLSRSGVFVIPYVQTKQTVKGTIRMIRTHCPVSSLRQNQNIYNRS